MPFRLAKENARAKIIIIGVGGAGGNAVNTMVERHIAGVTFVAANTDSQDLMRSKAAQCIQLGASLTKGLGAGANPEIGRLAAEEGTEKIRAALQGADMVFVVAGLGGGTGTGGAPVIAGISRKMGALTIGIVTRPFSFEGSRRAKNAEAGWKDLEKNVDTIITIHNDKLLKTASAKLKFLDCMKYADDFLADAVKGIADLINLPGYINPDFADVKTIMKDGGPALIGLGRGIGERRGIEAARSAVNSPLLEQATAKGAAGLLINICCSPETLVIAEVEEASSYLHKLAHEEAVITLGIIFDEHLAEELLVTVVATGIPKPVETETINFIDAAKGGGIMEAKQSAPAGKKKRSAISDADFYETPAFIRKLES